jgi:hypothetical protein
VKAKEYLGQIRKYDILLRNKMDIVENLREQATSITAKMDKVNVKSTSRTDRLEDTIVKIIDLENRILSDIEKITTLKGEVIKTIDAVDDGDMINILYKRYVHYEEWTQIADELAFSIQHIHRLHGRALLVVQSIINKAIPQKEESK